MIAQLQITWTEPLLRRAERFAKLAGRTIEEMYPVLLILSAPTFTHILNLDRPVSELSDEDVLAIANLQMLPEVDARYSDLIHAKGRRPLTPEEEVEVRIFTDVYGIGLVYKAEALAQAVKRGLREPLES
jgi:hypothetical protein